MIKCFDSIYLFGYHALWSPLGNLSNHFTVFYSVNFKHWKLGISHISSTPSRTQIDVRIEFYAMATINRWVRILISIAILITSIYIGLYSSARFDSLYLLWLLLFCFVCFCFFFFFCNFSYAHAIPSLYTWSLNTYKPKIRTINGRQTTKRGFFSSVFVLILLLLLLLLFKLV